MRFRCFLFGCHVDYAQAMAEAKDVNKCLRCGAEGSRVYWTNFFRHILMLIPTSTKVEIKVGEPYNSHGYKNYYTAPPCGYLAKAQDIPLGYEDVIPFREGDTVFIFGDIDQMPEHCVLATQDGKVHWGYHTSQFVKLTDEEA